MAILFENDDETIHLKLYPFYRFVGTNFELTGRWRTNNINNSIDVEISYVETTEKFWGLQKIMEVKKEWVAERHIMYIKKPKYIENNCK